MKSKLIETSKATILVVDMPIESTNIMVRQNNIQSDLWYDISNVSYMENLPDGTWQHLGQLSDITEDQWKDVVDDPFIKGLSKYEKPSDLYGWKSVNSPMGVRYEKDTHIGFKDYNAPSDGLSISNQYLFGTATESGLSLLKANVVVLENLISKPVKYKGDDFFKHQAKQMYDFAINRWQQAQEQIWKNVHIFIKK